MADVRVSYTGTSVEIDVRPRGLEAFIARWVPGRESLDVWVAFDRELRNSKEINVALPGGETKRVFLK